MGHGFHMLNKQSVDSYPGNHSNKSLVPLETGMVTYQTNFPLCGTSIPSCGSMTGSFPQFVAFYRMLSLCYSISSLGLDKNVFLACRKGHPSYKQLSFHPSNWHTSIYVNRSSGLDSVFLLVKPSFINHHFCWWSPSFRCLKCFAELGFGRWAGAKEGAAMGRAYWMGDFSNEMIVVIDGG